MSPAVAALPPAPTTVLHASVSQQAAPNGWQDHTVKAGETVWDLAARYGTTVAAMVARNDLDHGGRWISIGATLEVPRASGDKPTASKPAKPRATGSQAARNAKSSTRETSTVTVRSGETLSGIAARLKVSMATLVKANRLGNPDLLYPGQVLKVSRAASTPDRDARPSKSSTKDSAKSSADSTSGGSSSGSSNATYTVRSGDTLSHIAVRHGIPLSELVRANSSINPGRLAVGQRILLPTQGGGGGVQPWTKNTIGDAKSDEKVQDRFLHYTYPNDVARAAAANKEYLAGASVPSRQQTRQMITSTAKRHGVDHRLALAVSYQESGWNQRAVSPANAIGAMQVIPSSGDWASQLSGRKLNLLDPQDNVTAGVVILRALLRAADDGDKAIAGYYQGLAGVQKHGMYSDTKYYVAAVKAHQKRM